MMPLFQVESKVVHQIAPIITRWQEKIKKKLSRPGRGPNVVPVLRQGVLLDRLCTLPYSRGRGRCSRRSEGEIPL